MDRETARFLVLGCLLVHPRASDSEVASKTGVNRKTVRRYRDAAAPALVAVQPPPVPKPAPVQTSLLDSGANGQPPRKTKSLVPSQDFLRWWGEYPVKRNRYKAWEQWRRQKLDQHVDVLVEALLFQIQAKKKIRDRKEFVEDFPHGERYIRDRRWHDVF